jgi:hypothetical protein
MMRNAIRVWLVLAMTSILLAGVARAQDRPASPTPPPTAAPDAPGENSQNPMAAQIGAMIGGAEFMLILDKPYEAEKLFNAILQMDPGNAYAQQGLERVKFAKRPLWTFLGHAFLFNLDMSLYTYGGGPSFYSPHLKTTVWIGDGWYKNNIDPNNPDNPLGFLGYIIGEADDAALRKQTYNLTLEPYYKQVDGYIYLNRTVYQEAPDRTLWTTQVTWNRKPGRERYSAWAGQHDSYFQGSLAQYFAPESWSAVQLKILSREVGVGAAIPIGKYVDVEPSYQYFDYTDGDIDDNTENNTRRFARLGVYYRIRPSEGKQMPIFRVGMHFVHDDADRASLYYYAPPKFHQIAIAADYTYISGNTKYGIYGFVPINKANGEFPLIVTPPNTLFGFINHKLNRNNELWFKFAGLYTRNSGPRFGDYVAGINFRF